jgi:hypothetical protein
LTKPAHPGIREKEIADLEEGREGIIEDIRMAAGYFASRGLSFPTVEEFDDH